MNSPNITWRASPLKCLLHFGFRRRFMPRETRFHRRIPRPRNRTGLNIFHQSTSTRIFV
jgi:hypothetical protein